jgi:putative tricarboxylic transport membrane protein
MHALSNIALGFSVSLQPLNLLVCFAGVSLGVIVGILPGLGSAATIALLLPITYFLPTTGAIIMLSGIWYGSMYGGTITAILLNIPGHSTSVMVAIDGHEMTRQGRAGVALGISMISAYCAGLIGLLGLSVLAPTLAEFALDFGPPEYLALTVLGLTLVGYLGTNSALKAAIVTAIGLLLGTVGLDPVRSMARFTFGTLSLQSGLDLVPMVMGLFGLAEVFTLLEEKLVPRPPLVVPRHLREVLPSRNDLRQARRGILQGSVVGLLVGVLPGGGATISSYVAYALAKRWAHPSQQFGKGAIAGVAAPEAATNAATCAGFIPLLTLGLPDNVVMALMLGAFMLHGVTPGPTLMVQQPDMFWAIVTSMFIGNTILLAVMLPLIGQIAKVALLPTKFMVPIIVLACLAGAYGVNNNASDIVAMTGFGMLGYLMRKVDFPLAPLVLAFVIGPIMEMSLRQSLIMSGGSFSIFIDRGLSGSLLAITALVCALPLLRTLATRAAASTKAAASRAALRTLAILLSGASLLPVAARAADFPPRSISIIVPYPPGGRTDLAARALGQAMKDDLKVAIPIVNRPGASGVIGANEVANAPADGSIIGVFSTGFLTSLYTVPTPPDRDKFKLVALFNLDPAVIAATKSRGWTNLPDLLTYARSHPNTLHVGINAGSSAQMFAVAFMQAANITPIYVPFRGGGERTVALAGGTIDVDFDIIAPMKPMVEAGKIQVLGVASDQRIEDEPKIPTMAESGVDFKMSSWQAVFAPAATPPAIIAQLDASVKRVTESADFRSHMRSLELGVKYMSSPEFEAYFKEQQIITEPLMKQLGLYVEPSKK